MKVEQDRLVSLATVISKASPDFDAEQQRIALEVYRRLAEGSAAPASEIAQRSGVSTQRIEELLASWPGVYLDRGGRVVGFWGLTTRRLTPTHRFELEGRELFTWCAWDTLFLPGILDATAGIESLCPTTGEAISLEVSPTEILRISHPGAAVSFLVPDRTFDADVIQSFCHFVHFFASAEAGKAWTTEHPGTFLLPLDEAFELGRLVNAMNFPSLVGDGR
jgi:alkylmercury lyase